METDGDESEREVRQLHEYVWRGMMELKRARA